MSRGLARWTFDLQTSRDLWNVRRHELRRQVTSGGRETTRPSGTRWRATINRSQLTRWCDTADTQTLIWRLGSKLSDCILLLSLLLLILLLLLLLLLRQGWRSYVFVRSAILSVILSVTSITHDLGNERRPNMADMGWTRGDPLEETNFWYWSGTPCGFWIAFLFSSSLWNRGF